MDNRAKAQAHIERAQMYLGLSKTEFGQTDFGGIFDRFKQKRTDDELLARAATSSNDLMPVNKFTQAVDYVEKRAQGLKQSVSEKYEKKVDRKLKQRIEDLKNRLSESSITLAQTLAIEMENQIKDKRLALKDQRKKQCRQKTDEYFDGFEFDNDNQKSSASERASDMCEQYYRLAEPEYIEIIFNALESVKQTPQYTAWRTLEAGYIKLLHENERKKQEKKNNQEVEEESSEAKNIQDNSANTPLPRVPDIEKAYSAYTLLEGSVAEIEKALLNSQDPEKRGLVRLLAKKLSTTPLSTRPL